MSVMAARELGIYFQPRVIIRCRTCAAEELVVGTSAWNDAPAEWLIDQSGYYNPNGAHYCPRCSRNYWVAYCASTDDCEWCLGAMGDWSGLLVAARPTITSAGVVDSLHNIDATCPGGREIFDVERVEIQWDLRPDDAAIDLCL